MLHLTEILEDHPAVDQAKSANIGLAHGTHRRTRCALCRQGLIKEIEFIDVSIHWSIEKTAVGTVSTLASAKLAIQSAQTIVLWT